MKIDAEPFRGKFNKILDISAVLKLSKEDYQKYLKSLYPLLREKETRLFESLGNE